MTKTDAQVAREIAIDELKTINKYEDLKDKADSKETKDVVDDITREEKVHVGEASSILDKNDREAKPAMKEGVAEVAHKEASEQDRLNKSFRDVFGAKRGAVLAKANGLHVEKISNRERPVYVDDDGNEYEMAGVLPEVEEDPLRGFDDGLGGHRRGVGTRANSAEKKIRDKAQNAAPAQAVPQKPKPQGPVDYSVRPPIVNDFGQTAEDVRRASARTDDAYKEARREDKREKGRRLTEADMTEEERILAKIRM